MVGKSVGQLRRDIKMQNHNILVIDSNTDRHPHWRKILKNIHKGTALPIKVNVFDENHSNAQELEFSKRKEIDFTDSHTASKARQTYIELKAYDVTIVHINNYLAKDYIDHFKNNAVILVFSGGNLNGEWNKELVREIPIPLNSEAEFLSLNWKAAFEEFERDKTKPFPVHLLKPSLQNTYAFLILLQGYIAANFPDGETKNKLLPGWDKIKDKISIRNPEQTKLPTWWNIIKKDDLLRELKTSGKEKDKIDKSVASIEQFVSEISFLTDKTVTAVYEELKGFISS